MSQALYRKYRSTSLDGIVGQDHVTSLLGRSLEQGRFAHAYLLTGPRGVGKTSIARILAHEINKLPYDETASSHLDIIEIDAASNNGVDDVRDLREKARIAPVSAEYKIYIIDEVHMLSKPAFNALLKTLEEPPRHVIFILATTDVAKLPDTIISRTQRFSLRSITPSDAASHLRMIADKEEIAIDDEALQLIAERGGGSFRDSISLLDQLSSLAGPTSTIDATLVEQSLGLAPRQLIQDLTRAYETKELSRIVALLDTCKEQGVQPAVLAQQLSSVIMQQVADSAHLLPLLDALLDVERSSYPHIKLLTVLAEPSVSKPVKSAALKVVNSPAHEVSAPLKELARQATKKVPSETVPTTDGAAQSTTDTTDVSESQSVASQPFDWEGLIAHTRGNFVALYSVLSKCSYTYDGTMLVIYTGNAFYKKKLDQTKHRATLSEACQSLGMTLATIEVVAAHKPPEDAKLAAVAELMGGGIEVEVA